MDQQMPDLSLVLTWPQAVVAVVIILAVVVWPSIASWINSRAARAAAEDTRHQVHPNSGKSMRDGMNRMEGDVKAIKEYMASHQEYVEKRDEELDRRLEALENQPTGIFRRGRVAGRR